MYMYIIISIHFYFLHKIALVFTKMKIYFTKHSTCTTDTWNHLKLSAITYSFSEGQEPSHRWLMSLMVSRKLYLSQSHSRQQTFKDKDGMDRRNVVWLISLSLKNTLMYSLHKDGTTLSISSQHYGHIMSTSIAKTDYFSGCNSEALRN